MLLGRCLACLVFVLRRIQARGFRALDYFRMSSATFASSRWALQKAHWRLTFAFWGMLLLSLFSTAVQAQDLIRDQAWLDDPSGQLSWPEVMDADFQTFSGLLTRGFGGDRIWIRLRIDPSADLRADEHADATERLVLRIRPALFDTVELFDPLEPRSLARLTGLSHPWSLDEHRTLNLNFLILRGSSPRHVWLKIDSSVSRILHVEVLSQSAAREKDTQQSMWYGMYLGVVVMFLGAALVNWFVSRERLLLAFAIKQLFALIFSLFALGYQRVLLEGLITPHMLLYLHVFFLVVFITTALYYEYLFLSEVDPPRTIRLLMKAGLWIAPMMFGLILVGEMRLALFLLMHLVMLLPILGLVAVVMATYPDRSPSNQPVLPRKILVPVYVLIMVSVLLAVTPILGYRPASEFALHSAFFHSVITGALMVVLLQVRAGHIARARSSELTELAVAKEQARQDQLQRDEREKMLNMLAHELKTPLASIRMLLGLREPSHRVIDEIRKAVIDINEIVDRCTQAGRIKDLKLLSHPQAVDLVQELYSMQKRLSGQGFIRLEVPGSCWVTVDVQVLRMLLSNLMGNAVKYRRENTDVWVRLLVGDCKNSGFVCLHIDNLEGQSGRPDPRLVFSKYYRNPNARRKTGSGLGLFLVSELVAQIGSTVRYVDEENVVRFELCLPR